MIVSLHGSMYSMCMPDTYKSQKRALVPWNGSYRQLWIATWDLESELRFSARAAVALNCWVASSPQTIVLLLLSFLWDKGSYSPGSHWIQYSWGWPWTSDLPAFTSQGLELRCVWLILFMWCGGLHTGPPASAVSKHHTNGTPPVCFPYVAFLSSPFQNSIYSGKNLIRNIIRSGFIFKWVNSWGQSWVIRFGGWKWGPLRYLPRLFQRQFWRRVSAWKPRDQHSGSRQYQLSSSKDMLRVWRHCCLALWLRIPEENMAAGTEWWKLPQLWSVWKVTDRV